MRKLTVRAVAAASAAGALLVVAGAAWGSPPYTVAVGGSTIAGSHVFTGSTSSLIIGSASCSSATVGGTVTSGPSGVNPVMGITSLSASGCGSWTLTMASTTWPFDGTDPATTAATDDVAGTVHVAAHVQYAVPGVCQYDVSGDIGAHLDESTQTLSLAAPLASGQAVISNVSGCLGAAANGDITTVFGTFALAVPDGIVNLS